jgi:hypothetical protein
MGVGEKNSGSWWEHLKERYHVNMEVYRRITLKWVLKEEDLKFIGILIFSHFLLAGRFTI